MPCGCYCSMNVALQVRLEKSALFHPNQAMSCLSLLHVRGLPESPAGQNRLHALNTLVDLTGTEQVGGPSANAAGNVKDHNAHVAVTTIISEQTSALHVMNAISMQIVLGQDMVKEWHGLKECARAAVANSCACLLTFQLLTLQVCAAGALLSILHREGLLRSSPSASLAAPDRNDASLADRALRRHREADMHFCVESLSELHLLGHLCVDLASMHALQIFQVHLDSGFC